MTLLNAIGPRGRSVHDTFVFENLGDEHNLKPVLT